MIEEIASEGRSDATTAVGVVAITATAAALLVLAVPTTARPIFSLLVVEGLACVAVVAIRRSLRDAQYVESPFDPRSSPPRSELPIELEILVHEVQGVSADEPIPEPLAGRLRRCAIRRLQPRFGRDVLTDQDWRTVSSTVSPELFELLTAEAARVPGGAVPALVAEVEQL